MTLKPLEKSGIDKVIDIVGSQSALARELGVLPQAVQRWVKRGFVPINRAALISKLYKVPVNSLINPRYIQAISNGKK
jgi:DNA-binding transcriptional regulator YdaS (Cro superfamily)